MTHVLRRDVLAVACFAEIYSIVCMKMAGRVQKRLVIQKKVPMEDKYCKTIPWSNKSLGCKVNVTVLLAILL